ncbi:hypothetical protein [Alkalicoccobacillus gibsonii]|uniref:hypothetical protein n=1 Tax=Alkalicoccobacillus gibsonii TaxID=79881 RepID=UPI001933534F|nr:hypothetical protein [Alkalicoccobacillus gibsonii]MBM0064159.1 hypothetical protein [Alkalicoccobacillus gibsonii]
MKKRSIISLIVFAGILAACGDQEAESLSATNYESKIFATDQKESLDLQETGNEEEENKEESNEATEVESTQETEENVATKKEVKEEPEENSTSEAVEKESETEEEIESKEEPEPEPEQKPTYETIHHTRGALTVDGSTGSTVQTDAGTFTVEASLKNIQTLQSGPIQVQIKSASKISGEITEPSLAGVAGENVGYIQLDAIVTNSSEDSVLFYLDNTRLDSGSQSFYANEMFSGSGRGYGDLQPYTEHHITLFYMMDGANVGDIYSIYGLTDAPTDQASGATLGDPMKFQFSFTGA